MKKHRGKPIVQITDPDIEEYALRMTTSESEDVKKLVESSDEQLEYIDMLSGNMVGQLLKMLIKISGARRVLEIGTFTGYSALMMAEALPEGGELTTIEMNILYQELAENHFRSFDKDQKIILIKGDAREEVPKLAGVFDLIFLDADKLSYAEYYKNSLGKLASGGLLVVDNVLWDGTILEPQEEKAMALDAFNKAIADDDRVEQVLLPVRDGITIIRKK
ncbi:O-methyltransferase [Rhodohalobacter sp.]|uniref:O-methyltransferase n=1 Tax=Rhodohalobacter sp. TaxID=1974210 RepID=UPI002ACE5028|nr:class I SAM-dependent methyltransferase [Rhodohalobacter sp.]MDZ7756019.1 class I SAM-dependent methyltransferase [Rhodohalobacter sp.]